MYFYKVIRKFSYLCILKKKLDRKKGHEKFLEKGGWNFLKKGEVTKKGGRNDPKWGIESISELCNKLASGPVR